MACCIGGRNRPTRTPRHFDEETRDGDTSSANVDTVDKYTAISTQSVESLSKRDDNGRSIVHEAAQQGQVRLLRDLKEKGMPFNVADDAGVTPAHLAAENNRWDTIEVLHSLGAPLSARDVCLQTPAHYGAWHGHKDVLRVLHKLGVQLDSRDEDKKTPAHYAARQGHCAVLRFLFQISSHHLNAKDGDGKCPLFYATGDVATMFHTVTSDRGSITGLSPRNMSFAENSMRDVPRPLYHRSRSELRPRHSRTEEDSLIHASLSPRSKNVSPRSSPRKNEARRSGRSFLDEDANKYLLPPLKEAKLYHGRSTKNEADYKSPRHSPRVVERHSSGRIYPSSPGGRQRISDSSRASEDRYRLRADDTGRSNSTAAAREDFRMRSGRHTPRTKGSR